MKFTQIYLICFLLLVLATVAVAADRVLIIGIDNYKTVSGTPGSLADANAMEIFVRRKYRFAKESIKVLRESEATAANIKFQIQTWLIDATKPGDRVFLFYSGHGGQVDDQNGDERDELDEVLAPYDVVPGDEKNPPKNFITDDEMNVFLLKLSGRRVVMVVDSCHSGTISRSPEPKSKFIALKNKFTPFETTRSMTDRESYQPTDPNKKDLRVVKEDLVDGKLNGIVIFSAAAAYQKATWLKDRSRSVFSLAFEMSQKNENDFPTAAELNRRIQSYIEYLKQNKLAVTDQTPELEIISQTNLENKPLFGEIYAGTQNTTNWEAPVLSSLHNPLADFKVKINLEKTTFKVNDTLNYSIEISGLKPNETAYLYVLDFAVSPTGRRYVASIFPTRAGNDLDNRLGNGQHKFPREKNGKKTYETVAIEPGKDVFAAFVSRKPLNFGTRDEYTWAETFSIFGLDKLQSQIEQLTRGWGNRPVLDGGDWQADSVVVQVY